MNQGLGMIEGNLWRRSGQGRVHENRKYLRSCGKSQNISGRENSMFKSPAEMGYSKAALQRV